MILIVCGCPCTGKTYFLKRFKDYLEARAQSIQVLHLIFDQIINSNLEKQIIKIDFWKDARIFIQNLINDLISYLKTDRCIKLEDYFSRNKNQLFQISSSYDDIKEEIYSNFLKLVENQVKSDEKKSKYVLCLDDNMYYESMRFKYFQLAKRENCSYYCLCFKIRTLDKLIRLNKNRSMHSVDECFKITETIIENMFTKFNYPNTVKWEKEVSQIVEYEENFELELDIYKLFENVFDVISKLLSSFNLSNLTNDDLLAANTVANCSHNVNIKHQSDLIMRRLVKECVDAEDDKRKAALKLNRVKSYILEKLNKKTDDLYVQLNDLFSQNLVVYENYLGNYFLKLSQS